MAHNKITIGLNQSNEEVFKKSKEDNVSYFNFREINHNANGKLIYVYPGGTIGGGHIGIVPKNKAKIVGLNPEVVDYRFEDGKVVFDLIVESQSKKKGDKVRQWITFILLLLASFWIVSQCMEPSSEEDLIQNQFSTVDGRHYMLQIYVEDNLKLPESFEHLSTTYTELDSFLIVTMRYKAENLLRNKETFEIKAKVKKEDGTVLEILN